MSGASETSLLSPQLCCSQVLTKLQRRRRGSGESHVSPPVAPRRWKGHPTDRKALNVRKCRSPCPPGQEDPHEDPHDGPHIDFWVVFAFIIIFNLAFSQVPVPGPQDKSWFYFVGGELRLCRWLTSTPTLPVDTLNRVSGGLTSWSGQPCDSNDITVAQAGLMYRQRRSQPRNADLRAPLGAPACRALPVSPDTPNRGLVGV